MKLIDIKIKDLDGNIKSLDKAIFIKNKGIQGDIKARGGDRQVSILSLDTRKAINKLGKKGLCIPRFYENLIIEGLDPLQLAIGQRIKVGSVILEVSQIGKECFDSCQLVQEGENCPLSSKTIFARIIEGGEGVKETSL